MGYFIVIFVIVLLVLYFKEEKLDIKDGKIKCPHCKNYVEPAIIKQGAGRLVQRICPLCTKKIGKRQETGGCCFIATAAYGSNMDDEVQVLSIFRDEYLSKNLFGKAFIKFYYFTSPPIAKFISKFRLLRAVVRIILYPIVYFVDAVFIRND
ncbi:MAG: hypothetical protein PHP65_07135 [Bacilli bacterium]|nr:hypothetical protein [Bacilli bacterium]